MTFDPDRIQFYVKGAHFPATGEKLADVALDNGAPAELLDALLAFKGRHFDTAPILARALARHSGQTT